MKLKEQITNGYDNFRLFWNTPPLGRYMNYKEIFSLSTGGIGIKLICYCVQNMILSVGNTLIGNTIGIAPRPLYAIYLISIIASFPLTALRARMIDNAKSMKGKYRPYILSMGIPTVILGAAFIWMPYENMSLNVKCVVVLLFNIAFQFFYMFMNDAYDSIINVLSPNTIERSDVASIKAVVENFSPSIANIFLPFVARLITGDNTLYDLRVYRVIYPPMLLVGLLLSILIYVNTEEKIIQAKTHVIQIKFFDAFRAVARNKYFWIFSLAGWLGFLESSFSNILGWLYNYQKACTAGQYSLITAITGNASFWPMLFAPFFIRKFGKRNILIYSNLMSIGFILMMHPVIVYADSSYMIWLLLVCFFINTLVTALGHILNPSINADIRDYQQYISGERIDGMFAAVGLVGSVITLATSYVLPAIYESAGLNETVAVSLGYSASNVYDVLNNTYYFNKISSVLIYASAVGAVLNVIPFFFYDLTEIKQKSMVTVLKIRALFEDYGNDALSDESLVEAIDIIKEANEYVNKTPHTISKAELKQAKKSKDNAAITLAKANKKLNIEENEKIEIAQYVIKEITRFDTPEGQSEIADARRIIDAGLNGFAELEHLTVKEARALPKGTVQEKEHRTALLERARKMKTARKTIAKYFSEGLVEKDLSVFDELFAADDETETALREKLKLLSQAKEEKNRELITKTRNEITVLQKKRTEIKQKIKQETNSNSTYNRAAKPYMDAKKLLLQQENYKNYDKIAERYAESKVRAEQELAAQIARNEQEKAERKAYAARVKLEKEAAKAIKKNKKKNGD